MHAEPTVFGLKFLGFLAEFRRHNKNLKRDALGNLEGRIHVEQQEIGEIAIKKMPALQKRNKDAFDEQVRTEDASKELLENKRKFASDEMDVDEKPKKKSKK